jgi:deoxycytidylate deaminase
MKKRFVRLAKKCATNSEHKFQLGCVIVKNNKVIGAGWNTTKTHTKSPQKYKTLHAEMSALFSAKKAPVKGAEAYVFRILKNGEYALAKPCPICENMLKLAGIKKVHYTTDSKGFICTEHYK